MSPQTCLEKEKHCKSNWENELNLWVYIPNTASVRWVTHDKQPSSQFNGWKIQKLNWQADPRLMRKYLCRCMMFAIFNGSSAIKRLKKPKTKTIVLATKAKYFAVAVHCMVAGIFSWRRWGGMFSGGSGGPRWHVQWWFGMFSGGGISLVGLTFVPTWLMVGGGGICWGGGLTDQILHLRLNHSLLQYKLRLFQKQRKKENLHLLPSLLSLYSFHLSRFWMRGVVLWCLSFRPWAQPWRKCSHRTKWSFHDCSECFQSKHLGHSSAFKICTANKMHFKHGALTFRGNVREQILFLVFWLKQTNDFYPSIAMAKLFWNKTWDTGVPKDRNSGPHHHFEQ